MREHKFVAAMTAGTGPQGIKPISPHTIEFKNFLRTGNLKGQAAHPIHDIMPCTHAAQATRSIVAPGIKGTSGGKVATFQLSRTSNRSEVVVKRIHGRAELPCGKAKEATARTHIDKSPAVKRHSHPTFAAGNCG